MKTLLTISFITLQIVLYAQIELLRFDAIRLCDSVKVEEYIVRPHIHQTTHYKDSLKIKIRLYENCGLNSNQGALVLKNDTIILMWTDNNLPIKTEGVIYENGTWFNNDSIKISTRTRCSCYMEITYVLKGIKKLKPLKVYDKIVFEKDSMYRIYTPKYEIYEGDTINYVDKLGIKRGKWVEFDSLGRIIEINYNRDKIHFSKSEYFEYHLNGKIALHTVVDNKMEEYLIQEKYDTNARLLERNFYFSYYNYNTNEGFLIEYEEFFDENEILIERKIKEIINDYLFNSYYYKD